ncbi:MAG: hypothetical protein JWM21_2988 [Acidobacteria bacterium]|nr:hypothetical protein [Acidobacteriota bacterium]
MQIKACSKFLALILLLLLTSFAAAAQSRDHLTPQEVELVQESQVLDKRTEIFVKAIERRMLALNGAAASNVKQLQKDSEKWGELPKGTRAELIGDIAKILEEAITNIDDVSFHDEKNPLLSKALRKLDTTAEQLITQLTPLGEQTKNADEISSISQALENAQSIIEAAKKLPAQVEPEKGKGKTKKPKEKP